MRGQAAHMSGEAADGVIGARAIDPTRRITADSFRTLMAKLGSRPVALVPSDPPEFVPQTMVEVAPEPPAEELAFAEGPVPAEVVQQELSPEPDEPEIPADESPSAGFDWTSLLTPGEPTDERREEEPEEQIETPAMGREIEEPHPPEPAILDEANFEPEEFAAVADRL